MRWVLRIAGGLVLVLVLIVVGLAVYLDEVIGDAIERGGSYALGVPTRVGRAVLRPLSGSLSLSELSIANPPGFDAEHFIRLGEGFLLLDRESLGGPTLEVHSLRLADVELALEKSGKGTNYDVILANMASPEDSAEGAQGEEVPEESGGGPALIIRELVIEDVLAHYDVAGGLGSVDVTIPEIRLTEIGGKDDPVTTAELTNIVVRALLASVARYGVNLPADLVKGLGSGLASLGSAGFEFTGTVGTTVVQGGSSLAGATADGAGSAAQAIGAGAEKAVDAIGGLFGGGDDENK
jgi:hypothetical protein